MTPRQPDPPALISRNMPAAEMIKILTIGSGIEDLTTRIDLKHCSLNPVATGGFGDIYHGNLLGMTRLRPSEKIAIKSIRQYPDDSPETKRMLKAAARELHTWSRLKHENVQTLLGLASFRDRIAMISPWISGGNLLDYIRGNPNADRCKLVEYSTVPGSGWLLTVWSKAYQSANAVAYIHELKPKIAHGDIKSGNFLVTDTGTVKLNDFGTTLVADATQRFTAEGTKSALAMSTRWTSPELLNEDSDTYSHEADVYALGMTILVGTPVDKATPYQLTPENGKEIFTGKIPFPDKQRDGPIIKFVTEGGRPTRPIEIPHCQDGDLLWDLLSSCWSSNPKSRPNANHVKEETGRLSQEGLALPSSVELE